MEQEKFNEMIAEKEDLTPTNFIQAYLKEMQTNDQFDSKFIILTLLAEYI